ncbi:hypothetical protein SKDZ_16G3710 [Saccharomyces kudriavzevii ZP591]|nr:hypothetical protein SKDZ_16G3710 [Saccharomyces kudriavzevii ZP591]
MSQSNLGSKKSLQSRNIGLPHSYLKEISSAGKVTPASARSNDGFFHSGQSSSTNDRSATSVSNNETTKTYPIRVHRNSMSLDSLNSGINHKKASSHATDRKQEPISYWN